MKTKFPLDMVLLAILLGIVGYLLACCAHVPPQVVAPKSLCIIEPQTGMCWTSKSKGHGIKLSEMRGFYGLSGADLTQMTTRLIWCEDHPATPEISKISDQILRSAPTN